MIPRLFEHTSAGWAKYRDYEWRTAADGQDYLMSFLRSYGERFDWMKEVFRDWAFAFVSVFLYERDKKKLDSTTKRLYRQGIACFDGNVPSYHLELREHPVMVWDFHSLLNRRTEEPIPNASLMLGIGFLNIWDLSKQLH